jgi:mRNA interferase MazF
MSDSALRWGVVIVDLEPIIGHEEGGRRRALVVSNEPFHRSGLMTVVPITAAQSPASYPNEVRIPAGQAGQTRDGRILCQQVRTLSQRRAVKDELGRVIALGYLDDPSLREAVRRALTDHLWLDRGD